MKSFAVAFLLSTSFFAFAAPANSPKLSKERIVFHTNAGDIVVALFPEVAPKTSAKFLKMVQAGDYDGVPIGRVEKGFVAQVFNYDARTTPLTAEQQALVSKIPAEFSSIPHVRGILSMAREDADINSSEFSFSFLLGDAPHLDHQYTVFGEVVQGLDVLTAIEEIPTEKTTPMIPVMVQRAEVTNAESLSTMQIQGVQSLALRHERAKILFEVFAAIMFFMTVVTPIYKSIPMRRRST